MIFAGCLVDDADQLVFRESAWCVRCGCVMGCEVVGLLCLMWRSWCPCTFTYFYVRSSAQNVFGRYSCRFCIEVNVLIGDIEGHNAGSRTVSV